MANIEDLDPSCFEPNYEERTYPIRGKIIAHFAMLEKNIESLLASEFSTDMSLKHKMQSIIFDRMTFESKRTALKTLLFNRAVLEGFVPSKKQSHPYKKLIESVVYLNTIRNQFAHFPTIQATNKLEYSYAIGLMEYRDSSNFKWYTFEDIDQIISKIQSVKSELLSLIKRDKVI